MADVSVTINEGVLNALLRGRDGEVAKDILRRTIKVEGRAKQLCPVDTGRLRSSITSTLGQDALGVFGVVGTDVEYAAFVELGTRFMGAQPFLRPALDAAK